MKTHGWKFLTTSEAEGSGDIVVVCPTCGLIRSARIPPSSSERHIDLAGDCPERPQPQERAAVRRTEKPA
jgi:hypothetical protein